MPKRPFEAEIIRIYEPDMPKMVKALRTVLEYNPKREEVTCESNTAPAAGENFKTVESGIGLRPQARAVGE